MDGLFISDELSAPKLHLIEFPGIEQGPRYKAAEKPMQNSSVVVITLSEEVARHSKYDNHSIATVNDHEIRISTMTEDYHWHCHPDSDESFLSLEGGLFIDFDDRTIELSPGQMITVSRGVRHRTRPMGERSVNLTFERIGAQSEKLGAPRE